MRLWRRIDVGMWRGNEWNENENEVKLIKREREEKEKEVKKTADKVK